VNRTTVMLAVCMMFFLLHPSRHRRLRAPPKPGPEVKDLDYNVGTWKSGGRGQAIWTDARWQVHIHGKSANGTRAGFFVTCHSEGTGPMGPGKGVSFLGYDPNEKVYTYHEFTKHG